MVDREQLLDAAERVIARNGSAATLEMIAAEAGVTKPMVYARIGSRADLSDALASRLADRLITAAGAELVTGVLDRSTLAAFVRATLETIAAHRDLFVYVTRGAPDDSAERALFLAARSAEPLAGMLAVWRAQQGHDPTVATPWAYGLVGMLNMVALWWLDEGCTPVEVVADQVATLMWSGMGDDG